MNQKESSYEPIVLDLGTPADVRTYARIVRTNRPHLIDNWAEQAKELAQIKRPASLRDGKLPAIAKESKKNGVWVYYPWRNCLVHCLSANEYARLRSSRNQDLILASEQKKFRTARIGIAGLNVGNPAALCIALESGAHHMKFADNDHLAASNLNRFRAGLCDVGLNKAVLSARQVYEIDPFAKIEVFDHGISPDNIEKFLTKPKIDVLVEEMDNLPLKIHIRELARKHGIPVVMVTGNGENVIIDVERFDLNPKLALLSGYLKPAVIKQIKGGVKSFDHKVRLARDFMGSKYLTARLRKSFALLGSKLAGIPQIAESSFLRGAAVCYVVRQIVTGAKVPSGRYNLRLETLFK